MQFRFYALISRMRYITRWGLMRNTFSENVAEHSHMVAVLAHSLALIRRDILGLDADPERCAAAALYHDASEILTGDLPTPIKYYNPAIKNAYKQVERVFHGYKAHAQLAREQALGRQLCPPRDLTGENIVAELFVDLYIVALMRRPVELVFHLVL